MKTQISNLRSGTKNQILNPNVDYGHLPNATSHLGHAGSSQQLVDQVYEKVKYENPEGLLIKIFDEEVKLKASWSLSRKSCSYFGNISKDFLSKFGIEPALREVPYLSIQGGSTVIVSNGKNSFVNVCPSLVEIL